MARVTREHIQAIGILRRTGGLEIDKPALQPRLDEQITPLVVLKIAEHQTDQNNEGGQ